METFNITVAQRGLVTLPQQVRKAHGIEPGQQLTLVDLDGVLILSQETPRVNAMADRLARELAERGETLETMLAALNEVRKGRA